MAILSYFPSGSGGEVTITVPALPTQKGELVYTGELLTPQWDGYDPEALTVNGVLSAVDAGSYVCVFAPRAGYCWEDKSLLPRNAVWNISKAEGKVTLDLSSVSIDTAFNRTAMAEISRSGRGELSALSSSPSTVSASIDGSILTVTAKSAGSATVTVLASEDTNYTSASAILEVTVVSIWKKYAVIHTLNNTLWIPSCECLPDDLEGLLEEGEISWSDCDESIYPSSSGSYPAGFVGYKSVSIDADGNIVAGSSSAIASASYLRYSYGGANDWYYVGHVNSSGRIYMFKLEVLSSDVYSRGDYIEDVDSILESTYPENGIHSDGFWYVRVSEGFKATDDGDGNISILNATVTDDGSGNLTVTGG